jgi:hypothetical protein
MKTVGESSERQRKTAEKLKDTKKGEHGRVREQRLTTQSSATAKPFAAAHT